MKDIWLNTGFLYHRARFNRVSLDVTLKKYGLENSELQSRLVCHPYFRPRRDCGGNYSIGKLRGFPIGKLTDACSWPVAPL